MSIVYIVMCGVLAVLEVFFLVRAVRGRDNGKWVASFAVTAASAICSVAVVMSSIDMKDTIDAVFIMVFVCMLEVIFSAVMILATVICCIVIHSGNKKKNVTYEKITGKNAVCSVLIPVLAGVVLTAAYFLGSIGAVHHSKLETERVKKREITAMAEFINDKYGLNVSSAECVYYHAEDYSTHRGLLSSETYNLPYLAVFDTGDEKITVADRKGYFSDNRQSGDINGMIAEYFSKKTGMKFNFVQFGKSYKGAWRGNDNPVNTVLQTKFGELITEDNIDKFINLLLEEKDLEISFYIRDDGNKSETVSKLADRLGFMKSYENIEVLTVYAYDGELKVKEYNPDLQENQPENLDDYYRFGCFYIDSDDNRFTYAASMVLDRGYNPPVGGEMMNGWSVNEDVK